MMRNRLYLAAAVCAMSSLANAAEQPDKPEPAAGKPKFNVLMIAIDDLNDWIGCLGGHPQVKTPHMDRLAARGTLFLNAHCQSPLCNPSRTSLLTGLRPTTTGICGLAPWFRTVEPFGKHITLPQWFSQNGYRTLTAGKVFHDAYPPRENREDGSEFTVWGYHGGFGPRPEKKFVETPDRIPLMDWGVYPERDDQQDDWKVASWAIEQLMSPPQEPFFLSVGLRHPHVPCYASQQWFDLYPDASLQMPPVLDGDRDDTPLASWYLHWKLPEPRLSWLKREKQWRPLVRAYLASVSFVDAMVGRVLDGLEASGLAERTVIVLWSDHGWHVGEKAITGKNSLWERATRVPLIFAGPGVTAEAKTNKPAELLDIYPTLIELCGLPENPSLEGHSLVPLLKDAKAVRPWPAITSHNQGNHGIRTERWRYIRYRDGSEELYDIAADPNEWKNLAADKQYAKVIEEHRQWLPKIDVPPAPGSRSRVITYENEEPYWEGQKIVPSELER